MEFLEHPQDASPLHGPEEVEKADAGGGESRVDTRVKHLARVPLFSGCTDEELGRIAHISKIVESAAGTILTEIGAPGDSFFFIIDGRVSVQTQIGSGDPLRPGDFFGEMSLLDGAPRSATIIATTDVRLLVVEQSHFWRLLDEAPDLVRRILMILSRRVRRLEQVVNTLMLGLGRT
ncbi:MAG TPA: cyclic nucleotide-binding domain-containing protein [Vicinamibacterales bacterium]|nr:cyclic nucleotide-binding domain-containing protein [Vicinamibacterales bacterium]